MSNEVAPSPGLSSDGQGKKPREPDLPAAEVSRYAHNYDTDDSDWPSASDPVPSKAANGSKVDGFPRMTPVTGRPSKAMKGRPAHICELCQPPKAFTRAEHLRRHQPSHYPPTLACDFPGCDRVFWRQDLLDRHKQKHSADGDMIPDRKMFPVGPDGSYPVDVIARTWPFPLDLDGPSAHLDPFSHITAPVPELQHSAAVGMTADAHPKVDAEDSSIMEDPLRSPPHKAMPDGLWVEASHTSAEPVMMKRIPSRNASLSLGWKLSDVIVNDGGLATILEVAATHPALEKERVHLTFESLLFTYWEDLQRSSDFSDEYFARFLKEPCEEAIREKSRKLLGLAPVELSVGLSTSHATMEPPQSRWKESEGYRDIYGKVQTQQNPMDEREQSGEGQSHDEDKLLVELKPILIDRIRMQIFREGLLSYVLHEAKVHDVDSNVAPLPHSLPNFVEKTWHWISFILPESRVPPGKRRIRWTCSCGQRLYDDYDARLDRVALDDLESRLRTNIPSQRSGERTTASVFFKTISDAFRRSMGWVRLLNLPIRVEPSVMDLPTHNNTARTSSSGGTERTPQPTGILYLLYCISVGTHGAKFHQNLISENLNDQELFKFLRTVYSRAKEESRWFTLRTTTSISLCKFFVDHSRYASVRQHNQSCTQGQSPDCVCLPPKDLVGQEYRCHPVPPNLMPPFEKNYLMHYFLNPDHLSPEQAWTFTQVPKRMHAGIQPGTDAFLPGWGIYFEDGWHFKTIYLLVSLATFISSLIFGVCWSVFKFDVQAAFGITSYWVTIVAMSMGFLALRSTYRL